MSKYDYIYRDLCNEIISNGYSDEHEKVRTVWKDGMPAHTKSVLNYQLKFDNVDVPILTTKYVAWKTAIKEILWIWQKKSNIVQELRDLNGTGRSVWDEWEKEDGTIGNAYGYQLSQKCRTIAKHTDEGVEYVEVDQVDYLLHELKNNPSSRRHIVTLWDKDDLDKMSLTPCAWSTHWQIQDNTLHLTLNIRSNDVLLGQPFNVFQYYVLQRMIAQVTELKLGTYTINIDNAHLYDRHIEVIHNQLQNEIKESPILKINPEVKNFYDFKIEDFELENYEHGGTFRAEVAI